MEKEKKKFPIGAEHYRLYEEIGQGVSASVHRALCIPNNEIIAIKILDFERCNSDLNNISREAQTMFLVDHANVLKSHCSFVSDHNLWVVMPYMAGGSCLHILKAAHPDGFEEVVIATILREVLKGLEYLHQHGHIHRDVKAGNILIDSRGAVKLGDLGVSACLFDSGDRQRMRNTFVGTPCWMAPEVMEPSHGYDFKADIWSFGITALELAHGHAPFSKYPPMKVLLMTLQNAPPSLDYERDKKFSKSFKQMIASCLVKDPIKRPSARKLMKHSFFKQARSNDYIVRKLLEGLPPLGERIKALKKKEEDMLAQKQMPDGEKEELSQNEYKRGISSWNFNLEDVKAQASLIQDDEPLEKDHVGVDSRLESQVSNNSRASDVEENDESNSHPVNAPSLSDSTVKCLTNKYEKHNDDMDYTGSNYEKEMLQCHSPRQVENNSSRAKNNDTMERTNENSSLSLHHRRATSSTCAYTLDIPSIRSESFKSPKQQGSILINEPTTSIESQDEVMSEPTPKTSKNSPANSEDTEGKVPVIQRKGRFKVTSENVDQEKGNACPGSLQKSQSLQVITPAPILSLASPTSAPSLNLPPVSLYSMLQSFLQTNITQRESILSMMKQISFGDFNSAEIGCTSTNMMAFEKSLLESAHDKEKELLQEITTLQYRLIHTQEELQRLKGDNTNIGH